MKSHFDQQDKKFDEFVEMTRDTRQRLAGLEHVCMYVWPSHIVRVRINRVRLLILLVVS